jgi:hypothetical protein
MVTMNNSHAAATSPAQPSRKCRKAKAARNGRKSPFAISLWGDFWIDTPAKDGAVAGGGWCPWVGRAPTVCYPMVDNAESPFWSGVGWTKESAPSRRKAVIAILRKQDICQG